MFPQARKDKCLDDPRAGRGDPWRTILERHKAHCLNATAAVRVEALRWHHVHRGAGPES